MAVKNGGNLYQGTKGSVKEIYSRGLCTGCGTCAIVCPLSVIEIVRDESRGIYVPEIDENTCTECGLCLEVCPGHSVNFKELNLNIFGKEPENSWLGNYIDLYVGHATDYQIRYSSSSGGVLTALLVLALEEGIIDGALVTRMNPSRPLEPEVIIARNREDIISSSGSKYCPVPANIGLRTIGGEKGRFATVGLPCHIHGLRKLEMVDKKLKDKIVLKLGLMCSNNTTFLGTEYFLKKHGVKVEDIEAFYYRRGGWLPKKEITITVNGQQQVISTPENHVKAVLHSYLDVATYHRNFVIPRCILCCDHTCELADISFGDPRLPDLLRTEKIGQSLMVSRTPDGEEILNKALSKKRIELYEKMDSHRFFQAQPIYYKKGFNARLALLKRLGKAVPEYNTPKLTEPVNIHDYIDFFHYLPSYFTSRKRLWDLLYIFYFIDFVILFTRDAIRLGGRLLRW